MHFRSEVLRLSATDPNTPPTDLSKALASDAPVEHGEYLYWMERFISQRSESASSPLDVQDSGRLVRCRLDGTERRILWNGQDERGELMRPGPFFFHQGRLYIQYAVPRPGAPIDMSDSEIRAPTRADTGARVAVLYPERTQTPGPVRMLPSAAQMLLSPNTTSRTMLSRDALADGGFLYVYVVEQKRNPLDFLSSQTTERNTLCLYRVPLPE